MKTERTNLVATQLFKARARSPHGTGLNRCLAALPIKPSPLPAERRIFLEMTALCRQEGAGCGKAGWTWPVALWPLQQGGWSLLRPPSCCGFEFTEDGLPGRERGKVCPKKTRQRLSDFCSGTKTSPCRGVLMHQLWACSTRALLGGRERWGFLGVLPLSSRLALQITLSGD